MHTKNIHGTRDLRGVNLSGVNLEGAELEGVDLRGALMDDANLRDANLGGAHLRHASLRKTDLTRATLAGADLRRSRLAGATLAAANLSRSVFDRADLHFANLIHATLHEAQGERARLGQATLTAAVLDDASLRYATLAAATIDHASLVRTNLADTNGRTATLAFSNLQRANLSNAQLQEASLVGANLTDAILTGADFSRARMGQTLLLGLDLRSALGLDEVRHIGPSHLDESSLSLSRGRIPDAFLRGVGFSDWQLQIARLYDPTLSTAERSEVLYEVHRLQTGSPIVFHSVFISYSTVDEEFCVKLHADLQGAGVRCWFAPHDVRSGRKLHEQLERAIHRQDRLLLILSQASMSSNWVKTEIENARAKERLQMRPVLFPIRLVPFSVVQKWKLFDPDRGDDSAREVRDYYIPDFENWRDNKSYQVALNRLIKDLRAEDSDLR
jgi:uncharacterized protein YjbI with pentapeptide repeats